MQFDEKGIQIGESSIAAYPVVVTTYPIGQPEKMPICRFTVLVSFVSALCETNIGNFSMALMLISTILLAMFVEMDGSVEIAIALLLGTWGLRQSLIPSNFREIMGLDIIFFLK